jgi:hypothetical protein
MRARRFRITTLTAVAVITCCLPLGTSPIARAADHAKPITPVPAGSHDAPVVLNQGSGATNGQHTSAAPVPAPRGYPVPAHPLPAASNYYVHPGEAGLVGAELYVSPRPTPPLVGHTFITYPPLAPHEFLYRHHRVYHTNNPGSGETRTRVRWN